MWGYIAAPKHPLFLKILYTTLEVYVQRGRKWDTTLGTELMMYYTGPHL